MNWMGIHDLGTFVTAVVLFLMLPGPGTFTLLGATGQGGMRAGYVALAGLILGDQMLIWLAVAGVAALLRAHPTYFHAMQYLGAAYLAWLGLRLLFGKARSPVSGGLFAWAHGRYFRQGLLVTLLNPKAIVFYMAFFPLFVDPTTQRGVATFGTMATIIAMITLCWCSLLIVLGHSMSAWIRRREPVARGLRRFTGIVLVGFGLRLGASTGA